MICGWTQWRISNTLDEGKPLPGSIQKHLLACPDCREFYKRSLQIAQALTEPSLESSSATAETLARRLTEAATHSTRAPGAGGRITPWIGLAAAAMLMIAASVLVPMFHHADNPTGTGMTAQNPVSALQTLVRDVRPTGAPLPSSAAQWQSYLAGPYQRELNLIARDTDSAVKFVASCAGFDLSNRTIVPEPSF